MIQKMSQWDVTQRALLLSEAVIFIFFKTGHFIENMECFKVTSKLWRRLIEEQAGLSGRHLFCCPGFSFIRPKPSW